MPKEIPIEQWRWMPSEYPEVREARAEEFSRMMIGYEPKGVIEQWKGQQQADEASELRAAAEARAATKSRTKAALNSTTSEEKVAVKKAVAANTLENEFRRLQVWRNMTDEQRRNATPEEKEAAIKAEETLKKAEEARRLKRDKERKKRAEKKRAVTAEAQQPLGYPRNPTKPTPQAMPPPEIASPLNSWNTPESEGFNPTPQAMPRPNTPPLNSFEPLYYQLMESD